MLFATLSNSGAVQNGSLHRKIRNLSTTIMHCGAGRRRKKPSTPPGEAPSAAIISGVVRSVPSAVNASDKAGRSIRSAGSRETEGSAASTRSTTISPSRLSIEQFEKTTIPPGRTRLNAFLSRRSCRSARVSISASSLIQGTSGWRRQVPVEEHGASSSAPSNSVSGTKSSMLDCRVSAARPRRDRFSRSRVRRLADWSSAVTSAPAATSCAVFPPGAAQRSTIFKPLISPNRRAGIEAAASCTHQSPASKPSSFGMAPASEGSRTEPVGKTRPPSFRAQPSGSDLTVRSMADGASCDASIAAAVIGPYCSTRRDRNQSGRTGASAIPASRSSRSRPIRLRRALTRLEKRRVRGSDEACSTARSTAA